MTTNALLKCWSGSFLVYGLLFKIVLTPQHGMQETLQPSPEPPSGFPCQRPLHTTATIPQTHPHDFTPLPFAHPRSSWNVAQMSFPSFSWQNQAHFLRPKSKVMSPMIPGNPLSSRWDSASLPVFSFILLYAYLQPLHLALWAQAKPMS